MGLYQSVSDKWELFDSHKDIVDIGNAYFALESLDNKTNASTSKKINILVFTLPKLDKSRKSVEASTRPRFCTAVVKCQYINKTLSVG